MYKNVKYLIPAYDVDMGGIKLKQALPTNNVSQVDPFLLLHHAKFTYTENAPALHQGLGPHPHRGFTPVTFVIEGEVHHRDSRGNNQIAKKRRSTVDACRCRNYPQRASVAGTSRPKWNSGNYSTLD